MITGLISSPLQGAGVAVVVFAAIFVLFLLEWCFRSRDNANILEGIFIVVLLAFPAGLLTAVLGFATRHDDPMQAGLAITGVSFCVGVVSLVRYAHRHI
jgi:quinol-cytochrome oxidoreductase complex cytochrome b subunit